MRDEQQQENSGAGTVQINGNYNTVNHHTHQHDHYHQHQHQHSHILTGPLYARGPVVIHTLVQQQAPFALQAPLAPQARKGQRTKTSARITPAQKDLLELMRPLPKPVRHEVMAWMRTEFGTALVMALEPRELHCARKRVLDVRLAAGVR
ncbi:hypothetical protein [Rhodoferax sp.]|uniref:hypothetical protein n=1 Tax=Rhodoferax sp. TaxID=50421 RepID=UPI0025E84500|nr:hypothetical protein [Rhodoferax sp.]MCM2340450.1 hypothetical protein [Rhodoferax sp.]